MLGPLSVQVALGGRDVGVVGHALGDPNIFSLLGDDRGEGVPQAVEAGDAGIRLLLDLGRGEVFRDGVVARHPSEDTIGLRPAPSSRQLVSQFTRDVLRPALAVLRGVRA